MTISIDKDLLGWAINHIHIQVAIRRGVYHDQPTIMEDMQKIIDEGHMPKGWYKLKKAFDEASQ